MAALKLYQVDAFADTLFKGNPAAVMPLQSWLTEDVMQKIAAENNLSETAFLVPQGDGFHIRWFTPTTEIDLCGHATLAAAHVLLQHENYQKNEIHFHSQSGLLKVLQKEGLLYLDFPADITSEKPVTPDHKRIIGNALKSYHVKGCGMAVFEKEEEVLNFVPNLDFIRELEENFLIITAPGNSVDFVSRCFGPKVGINEDPVTGSAHTRLIPYWAERTGKKKLTALQLSQRGGSLTCEHLGERVLIGGKAVTYLVGEVYL